MSETALCPPELTAEQVEAYLRRTPEFFEHRLSLLGEMLAERMPPPPATGVADFQAHALRALRQEVALLKETVVDLTDTARHNLTFQERTHRAVRAILAAPSFDALVRCVTDTVPALLQVNVVMLCVESGLPKGAAIYVQELQTGATDRLIGHGVTTRLRHHVESEPLLYGSDTTAVRSDALVRLSLGDGLPAGLLALGSRHSGTFSPEQGTELLVFFADVLSATLRRWVL